VLCLASVGLVELGVPSSPPEQHNKAWTQSKQQL